MTSMTKLLVAVLLLALGGCTTAGISRPTLPSLPGKGGGDVGGTILAQLGSGLIGTIGEGLSKDERRSALEAEYRALERTPSGQAVAWSGSDAGRRGAVTAAQPYRVGSQDCRQYTHTAFLDGRSQSARGTACRNADGSWTPLT